MIRLLITRVHITTALNRLDVDMYIAIRILYIHCYTQYYVNQLGTYHTARNLIPMFKVIHYI